MNSGCSEIKAPTMQKCKHLPKQNIMENKTIKVTSKKDGVVFGSDASGGVKVSLHGLTKEQYKSMRRGKTIKF